MQTLKASDTATLTNMFAVRRFGAIVRAVPHTKSLVSMTFIDPIEGRITVSGNAGDSLLELAHKNNVDLEGACGGELACSTCHLTMDPSWYSKSLKLCPKTEEEEDMLDLAWGLCDTSRLGCQVLLSAELDGLEVHIPDETDNMQP